MKMPSDEFSKAILEGMRVRGMAEAEIIRITGLSSAKLSAVRAGKRRLSDRVLDRIERETGVTGGQLAALSVEPDGGPLTDLCEVWGKFAESTWNGEAAPRGAKRS
jgi:hypothetical protein